MLQLRIPLPRFIGSGEVLHGRGSLSSLRMLDGVHVVVIASRSVLKYHRALIEKSINHLKLTIIEYSGGEPTLDEVFRLAGQIRQERPDWITAIGGGSVMDAAKLAWVLYEQPEADFEILSRPFALRGLRGCCRFIAVPTTAGTGSEVSSAALLSDPVSGSKKAIVSHELLPDIAILDPEITINVPKFTLVAAGIDALAHSVESYVSRFSNPFADIQIEKSVAMILQSLPRTISDPEDHEVRLEMMLAAMMAGWAQNLKVPGLGHALAHQLGRFGINHGMACGGLLVPSVCSNMIDKEVKNRYRILAEKIGESDEQGLINRIHELKVAIGFPENLRSISEKKVELDDEIRQIIFKGAQSDICARANPMVLTDDILGEVLNEAW